MYDMVFVDKRQTVLDTLAYSARQAMIPPSRQFRDFSRTTAEYPQPTHGLEVPGNA
jgi:hypothetical protein